MASAASARETLRKVAGLRKKPSLIELLRGLPNQGVGASVARKAWRADRKWHVEEVRPDKHGVHGRVWGTLYYNGKPRRREELPSPNKRGVWRIVQSGARGAS